MSFQENKKTGRINAAAAAFTIPCLSPESLEFVDVIGRSSGLFSVVHLPISTKPTQWFEETTGVIFVQ